MMERVSKLNVHVIFVWIFLGEMFSENERRAGEGGTRGKLLSKINIRFSLSRYLPHA